MSTPYTSAAAAFRLRYVLAWSSLILVFFRSNPALAGCTTRLDEASWWGVFFAGQITELPVAAVLPETWALPAPARKVVVQLDVVHDPEFTASVGDTVTFRLWTGEPDVGVELFDVRNEWDPPPRRLCSDPVAGPLPVEAMTVGQRVLVTPVYAEHTNRYPARLPSRVRGYLVFPLTPDREAAPRVLFDQGARRRWELDPVALRASLPNPDLATLAIGALVRLHCLTTADLATVTRHVVDDAIRGLKPEYVAEIRRLLGEETPVQPDAAPAAVPAPSSELAERQASAADAPVVRPTAASEPMRPPDDPRVTDLLQRLGCSPRVIGAGGEPGIASGGDEGDHLQQFQAAIAGLQEGGEVLAACNPTPRTGSEEGPEGGARWTVSVQLREGMWVARAWQGPSVPPIQ